MATWLLMSFAVNRILNLFITSMLHLFINIIKHFLFGRFLLKHLMMLFALHFCKKEERKLKSNLKVDAERIIVDPPVILKLFPFMCDDFQSHSPTLNNIM